MLSSFSKVSCCMITTNILRAIQFTLKLILWWIIFIDTLTNLGSTRGKLMVSFSVFFFAWYQFWRFVQMLKRIKKYHLQWSFSIFDLAAVCIIKSAYIETFISKINGSNLKYLKNLSTVTAIIYVVYLTIPITIFIVWINVYCRMREVTQKMGTGMLGDVALEIGSQVSIQTLASQKLWFKVLVMLNIAFAFALAILSAIGHIWYSSLKLKKSQKLQWSQNLFIVSLGVDLCDVLFNFIQDRIIVYYATKDSGTFLPEVPLTPFTCCDCGAFGYADFIALRQSEQEVNLY